MASALRVFLGRECVVEHMTVHKLLIYTTFAVQPDDQPYSEMHQDADFVHPADGKHITFTMEQLSMWAFLCVRL